MNNFGPKIYTVGILLQFVVFSNNYNINVFTPRLISGLDSSCVVVGEGDLTAMTSGIFWSRNEKTVTDSNIDKILIKHNLFTKHLFPHIRTDYVRFCSGYRGTVGNRSL